jgi:hypothetical protein
VLHTPILGVLGVRGVQGVRARARARVQHGVFPRNFGGKSPRVGEWKGMMTANPTPLPLRKKRTESLKKREVFCKSLK